MLTQIGSDVVRLPNEEEMQSAVGQKKQKIQRTKAKRLGFSSHKESITAQGLAKDVVVMLVKEITRSKDETIEAKDKMIELLMNRKCTSCGNGSSSAEETRSQ